MKTFKIPVEWVLYGEVEIQAKSIEEAIEIAREDKSISLPDGEYLSDSWRVNEDMGLIEAINDVE